MSDIIKGRRLTDKEWRTFYFLRACEVEARVDKWLKDFDDNVYPYLKSD
jgi:hypothetical protein